MPTKLIIDNRTKLSDEQALLRVVQVVNEGKISKTSKGVQYCFEVTFKDGMAVYTTANKNSVRFTITKQ